VQLDIGNTHLSIFLQYQNMSSFFWAGFVLSDVRLLRDAIRTGNATSFRPVFPLFGYFISDHVDEK